MLTSSRFGLPRLFETHFFLKDRHPLRKRGDARIKHLQAAHIHEPFHPSLCGVAGIPDMTVPDATFPTTPANAAMVESEPMVT